MLLELVAIDAMNDAAYQEVCREMGIDPHVDYAELDPIEFHQTCYGPFKRTPVSNYLDDLLPDGWIPAHVFNWCTDILLRDGHGRLIQIATEWGNAGDGPLASHFDGTRIDYPVISTYGNPADITNLSICARYIKMYKGHIIEWYNKHSCGQH